MAALHTQRGHPWESGATQLPGVTAQGSGAGTKLPGCHWMWHCGGGSAGLGDGGSSSVPAPAAGMPSKDAQAGTREQPRQNVSMILLHHLEV